MRPVGREYRHRGRNSSAAALPCQYAAANTRLPRRHSPPGARPGVCPRSRRPPPSRSGRTAAPACACRPAQTEAPGRRRRRTARVGVGVRVRVT
eukprot:scaffold3893_cov37-Phaeocystis_antarctica.AAC.1